MLTRALIILAALTVSFCEERKHKHVDPFTALDQHLSHTLAYHYLWPWSQLVRAAAGLDLEMDFQEPVISSDSEKFEVKMNVKRFKPDELRIKVKNRNVVVEGKHKNEDDQKFMANHFVQRFVLPLGSKQEEVTAVLNEKGVLVVTVPRHEVPPPPPERIVPIEVRIPEKTEDKTEKTESSEKVEKEEVTTERKVEASSEPPAPSTSVTPLENLELVEQTTHVGKIRKKELKDTTKTVKDNEVTKTVDNNGLDYALIDNE